MESKKVNSVKARQSFSKLLNESGNEGQRIIVTRKGNPVAAIVPLEDLEMLETLEDYKDIQEAEHILSDKKSEFIPWEKAKKELLFGN